MPGLSPSLYSATRSTLHWTEKPGRRNRRKNNSDHPDNAVSPRQAGWAHRPLQNQYKCIHKISKIIYYKHNIVFVAHARTHATSPPPPHTHTCTQAHRSDERERGRGEGGEGEGKRMKSDRIYTTPTQVTKGAVARRLELEAVFWRCRNMTGTRFYRRSDISRGRLMVPLVSPDCSLHPSWRQRHLFSAWYSAPWWFVMYDLWHSSTAKGEWFREREPIFVWTQTRMLHRYLQSIRIQDTYKSKINGDYRKSVSRVKQCSPRHKVQYNNTLLILKKKIHLSAFHK